MKELRNNVVYVRGGEHNFVRRFPDSAPFVLLIKAV
jgi:hypothetical protein